jgi:hypothetical protein
VASFCEGVAFSSRDGGRELSRLEFMGVDNESLVLGNFVV